MSIHIEFLIYSIIGALSFFSYMFLMKKSKNKTIGLVYIYIFNFSIVHFWGSVFFISPNYWNDNLDLTLIGYKYSTIAIICFLIGSLIFYFLYNKKYHTKNIDRIKLIGIEPLLFLIFGVITIFLLKPILHGLPTITVFVSMGQMFLVVGLCLLLYKNYVLNNKITFFVLIIFSGLIPFFTIINDGFLGIGVSMFLTIVVFISNFYKFNYRYIFLFVISIYLGLSFYQSYLRDRQDIRDLVWGGADYTERIVQMKYTLSNLEFFNPFSDVHLDRVNERLNQNWIIGASVVYLEDGYDEYAKGETVKLSIMNLIPRIIWKNKPIVAGDTRRVEKYTGIKFQKDTSVGMPHVMEMYVNFGVVSVVIGFLLFGFIFSYFDLKSFITFNNNELNKFILFFLPPLAFMRTETPIIDNLSGAVAAGLMAYGFQKSKISKKILWSYILSNIFLSYIYIIEKVLFTSGTKSNLI